jgi:hypothetical protein
MLRRLTLAIIEAMLRILAAFPAGAGTALPRSAARQRRLVAQSNAFGLICVAYEEPRVRRVRREPPDRPIIEGGWMGV